MGRFRYIPQRYENEYNENGELVYNKSLLDSDSLEINVKSEGIVSNTLIVYDDYKIPLNITEDLAKETEIINKKINDLYDTMNNIENLLYETSNEYETFENKVFGKSQYSFETNEFIYDEEHCYKPLNFTDINDSEANILPPLNFEIQKLDYTLAVHNYNEYYFSLQKDIIENVELNNKINDLENTFNDIKKNYIKLRNTVINTEFWISAEEQLKDNLNQIKNMKNKIDTLESYSSNMDFIKIKSNDQNLINSFDWIEKGDVE